jgi:hypothetical protein
MRSRRLLLLTLICLSYGFTLDARPGKGGGPRRSIPNRGAADLVRPRSTGVGSVPLPTTRGPLGNPANARGNATMVPGQRPTSREHALAVQRGNEERKLLQRQQTALRLREISERTGNAHLGNVADRMDRDALQHYRQRQQTLDEFARRPVSALGAHNDLADPLARPLTDQEIAKLDNPQLRQQYRLLNEERKLQQQLETAQKLRELSSRNGNPNLISTAERMEQLAADRYVKQLEQIHSTPLALEAPPAK